MAKTAIVIGAGIIGIATAYHLLKQGFRITLLEKNHQPIGASIRNFGMIWPIGQPSGDKYQLALASKQIWEELSYLTDFHLSPNGSLHLAYHTDEKDVLEEFISTNHTERNIKWLSPAEARSASEAVKPDGLLGAMHSTSEALVDPREAVVKLIQWLQAQPNCAVYFDTPVYSIDGNTCKGISGSWQADKIFVCSGSDIAMLYPDVLAQYGLLCELQMMRTVVQPPEFKLGPSLCAGLTLAHYGAFKDLKSLEPLRQRFKNEYADLLAAGIHVMAAQNATGEVTIGDSHEYALHFLPFTHQSINDKILDYLHTFCTLPTFKIQSQWKGCYFKLKDSEPYLILSINDHTTLVNGFGGLGMTLSFGAMQKMIQNI